MYIEYSTRNRIAYLRGQLRQVTRNLAEQSAMGFGFVDSDTRVVIFPTNINVKSCSIF